MMPHHVVVVAGSRLAGLSESAPVIGDDAVARFQKHGNLSFPRGAAEGVSVDQDHGLAGAVVFVIEMDGSRIFFTDINVGHDAPPCE